MKRLDNNILFRNQKNNSQDKQTNDKKAGKAGIEAQKVLASTDNATSNSYNINPPIQPITVSRNVSIIKGVASSTPLKNPTLPGTGIPLPIPIPNLAGNLFSIQAENETIQIIKEFAHTTSVKDVGNLIRNKIHPLIDKLAATNQCSQVVELNLLLQNLVNYNYNRTINDTNLKNLFKQFKTLELNQPLDTCLNTVDAHIFNRGFCKYTINTRKYLGILKILDILSNKLSKYQFDLIVQSINLQRLRFCYAGPDNTLTITFNPCVLHFLNHGFALMNAEEINEFLLTKINFYCNPNAGLSSSKTLSVSGLYLTLLSYNHKDLLMKVDEDSLVKLKGNIQAILVNLQKHGHEGYSSHIISTLKTQYTRGAEICAPGNVAFKYNYYLEQIKNNRVEDLILVSVEDLSNFIAKAVNFSQELKKIGGVKESEQIEEFCSMYNILKQFSNHFNFVFQKNSSNLNKKDIVYIFEKIKSDLAKKNKSLLNELTAYFSNLILFIQEKNTLVNHNDLFETIFSFKFQFNTVEKFAQRIHSLIDSYRNYSIEYLNKISFELSQTMYELRGLTKKNTAAQIQSEAVKWQGCGYDITPMIEASYKLGFSTNGLALEQTNLPLKIEKIRMPTRLFDLNENDLRDIDKYLAFNYFPISKENIYKLTIAVAYNKFKKYKHVYYDNAFFKTGIKISEEGFSDVYLQKYPNYSEALHIAFNFNDLHALALKFNDFHRSFIVHTLLLFVFLSSSQKNILILTYLKMLKKDLVGDRFADWLNAKFSAIFYDGPNKRGDLTEKSYSWLEIIQQFKNQRETLPDGSPNYDDIELLEAFLDKESKTTDLPKAETSLIAKLLKGYPSPFIFPDLEKEENRNVALPRSSAEALKDPLEAVEKHLQTFGGIVKFPPIQTIEETAANPLPDSVDPLEEMIRNTQLLDPFLEQFETLPSQKTASEHEDSDTEMTGLAMEVEEAPSSSYSIADEGAEKAETLPASKSSSNKRHIHIANKYLRTKKTDFPFLGTRAEIPIQDIANKIKYQFNPLKDVASIGAAKVYPTEKKIITPDGLFKGTYFTLDPSLDFSQQSRFTFVRAGRQLNALLPVEKENGRVVLVVTEAEEKAMKEKLSSHCDILVVKEFPAMGIQANDVRLKSPSLRMLAAISFAYANGLKNMIFMDDNIESVCADEVLPLNSSWSDVYECFRASAASEDYACLSPQTFRPEHQNLVLNQVRIIKNNFAYKLYYLDIDKLKQAIDNPRYLIPQNVMLWGEDIFFQIYLQISQLNLGSIDRKSLVITRSQKNKNSCTNVVKMAEDWLEPSSREGLDDAPENYRIAFERMIEIINKNCVVNEKHESTKVKKSDLAKITHQIYNSVSKAKGSKKIAFETQKAVEVEKNEKKQSRVQLALPETIIPVAEDFRLALVRSTENILHNAEVYSLRKVQKEALEKLLQFFSHTEKAQQAYFNIATGVGKSLLFLLLSMEVSKQMTGFNAQNKHEAKRHVLIIVPEIQLAAQTYKGFSDLSAKWGFDYASRCIVVNSTGVSHTLFGKNDRVKATKENIVIMCSASASLHFSKHPEDLNLFGLTIVDEFHSVPKNLLKLFNGYSRQSGACLLGFSATPTKEKIPFFGSELYKFGTHEGVRDKYLTPWVIDTLACDYNQENYALLINDLSNILSKRQHAQGDTLSNNQGIIYLPSIPETNKVHAQLKSKNIRSKVIHSDVDPDKRLERLQKFATGNANLLLGVHMLKKGVNLPAADYAIIAQEAKSKEDFVQMRGRLLRTMATKPNKIANLIVFRNLFRKANIPPKEAYCETSVIAEKISRTYLEQNSNYTFVKINQQIASHPNPAKRAAENELSGISKQLRATSSSSSNTIEPVLAPGEFYRKDLMTIPVPKEGGKTLAENLGVFLIAQQNDEQINQKVERICGILKEPGGDRLEQAVREGNLQKSTHPLAQQLDSLLNSLYVEANKGKGINLEYAVKSFTLTGEKFIPLESFKEGNSSSFPTVRLYRRGDTEQLKEVHYDLLVKRTKTE